MKKLILLACLLLGSGAWFWNYRADHPAKAAAEAAENLVAKVERRDIETELQVNGDVAPTFQVDVKSEVGGKVKKLRVVPGQEVQQGDLVAEIDDRDLLTEKASALTEIEGAQVTLNRAERNLGRGKELWERKLISREVFDNLTTDSELAHNDLTKAQRKLDAVEDKLQKTKVVAAIQGTVLSVPVIEGEVVVAAASVNSGTTLLVIADLTRLEVDAHVNQVDIGEVVLHKPVVLVSDSLRDSKVAATISFVAPVASVKNSIKGFDVEAVIEHPDPRLRPGMSVEMKIPVASVKEAVSVPIAAVFKGGPDSSVVYVRAGETTERRQVEIGVTNLEFAEIRSGVKVGEEILLVEPKRPAAKAS